MRRRSLLVGTALFIVTGCARNPAVDIEAETAAIRERFATCVTAETRRDMDGSVAFFAPDAIIQPEAGPAVKGIAAARELYQGFFALPYTAITDVEPRAVTVARSGDLASDVGSWKLSIPGPNGPTEERGKSTLVWRKLDGKWMIILMSFSMDAPAPPAAAAKVVKS